jgi:hypothetical protein
MDYSTKVNVNLQHHFSHKKTRRNILNGKHKLKMHIMNNHASPHSQKEDRKREHL